MQNFENFLLNHLPISKSIHPTYEEALQKMLLAGGKRFRPALLLGVVGAYNPLLIGGAYHAAYAIELLHTYSLIHDDLPAMDNSPLRRGEPTLHVLFDEVTAILVGDALNTYSFEVLSNAPFSDYTKVALIRELSVNGGLNGMVLGQAIDCYFENRPLCLEDVKTLHINKTAKLIAASLKMGAIIIGKEDLGDALYDFGIRLGLLFQIQDDILDVTQSSEEAGKLTNNDEAKNSFVTLLGLDEALNQANALADKLMLELNGFDDNLKSELSTLLTQYINRHK
ncbi:MAG: geranyl transferase [Sulfurimonas sp. RIFOXYD12_FULL_33_39]|uniref:polyprenyl synthetase family protein n=1 Tax=unclassified Sulfurimonas TaxID=2623549 RepID=UPI0008BA0CE1|nr:MULTISPECIES: polyprenyl synthetase family protein [unclassified Sulfurimonas]OHE10406.1 MAG: geranyl transferase [Sulfurimonas sp. RIFOXYD12_FULL_33_39]OHE14863.1 MAG: geranyl transferase [Sulfurimonas sp. RIFOXYD2_FULL_34_21]DAB27896.1 MAG TPA: geranyl transferase [Sulfurimonas sp. UBA10385]